MVLARAVAHGFGMADWFLICLGSTVAGLIWFWAYLDGLWQASPQAVSLIEDHEHNQTNVLERSQGLSRSIYHAWRNYHFGKRIVRVYFSWIVCVTVFVTLIRILFRGAGWQEASLFSLKCLGGVALVLSPVGIFGYLVFLYADWRLSRSGI
jgi:hypothetical protein